MSPKQHAVSSDIAIENWGGSLRRGFQPSRNRHSRLALAATAATAQRPGMRPLTSYREAPSRTAALTIARQIGPFDRDLDAVLSSRARDSIRRTVTNTHAAQTQGRRNTRRLERIGLEFRPLRERIASILPVVTPSRNLNIPLITFLFCHLDYPDKRLDRGLTKGMGITWYIPEYRALTNRQVAPTTAL